MDETTKANDVSLTDEIKGSGTSKDADSIGSEQIVKTGEGELNPENEKGKSNDGNQQNTKVSKLNTGEINDENKAQNLESGQTKFVERNCGSDVGNGLTVIESGIDQTKTVGSSEANLFSVSGDSSKSVQSKHSNGESRDGTDSKGVIQTQTVGSSKENTFSETSEKSARSNGESGDGLNGTESKAVIQTKNIQPRSILKTTASEPTIIVTPPPKPPQHSASSDDFRKKRGKKKYISYPNDSQTVQEFVNPAFELDENVPNDFRLADIVEQVLQQEVSKYQHPFGKGNLYNTVFLGEKSVAHTGGGRFILWFIFAFALVGMAGVIIFMSEIYKSDESGGGNLTSS